MLNKYVGELMGCSVRLVNETLSMTLFPSNCTTQCIFFLIVELKSKLLNTCIFLKFEKHYFSILEQIVICFFGHHFILKV